MKRVILFILTNILVMITLGIVTHVLFALMGTSVAAVVGDDWAYLAIVAFVYGLVGAFISLFVSKPMAKLMTQAHTIDGSEGEAERWLVETVRDLAMRAGVKMPEVAIYPGAANAFATGAFRNHALVAVSTDIMGQMTKEELRAVLGHEMSHVANGDMVTLTLVQGVLNAFVIFVSRVLATIVSSAGKGENRRNNSGLYMLVVWVMDICLGLLASLLVMAYSRRREYAADAGSARLLGSPSPMIAALRRLGCLAPGVLPDSLRAMGIAEGKKGTSLFASHPSLEDRITALQNLTYDISGGHRLMLGFIAALTCLTLSTDALAWSCYKLMPEGGDYSTDSLSAEAFVLHGKRTDEKCAKTGCLAIADVNKTMWTHNKLALSVRSLNGKKATVGFTLSHDTPAGVVMKSAPMMEVSGRAWREVVLSLDSDFGMGDAGVTIRQIKIALWISHWRSGEEGGIEVKNLRLCGPSEVTVSSVWRPGDTFRSIPNAAKRAVKPASPDALKVFFAFDNEDVAPSLHREKRFSEPQQYAGFRETLLEHLDGQAVVTTNLNEAQAIVYTRARRDAALATNIVTAVRERGLPLYAASEIGDPEIEALLPCEIDHPVPQDLPVRARVLRGAEAGALGEGISDAAFGVYRACRAKPEAKTLFKFADGTPAVVEGTSGKGRVAYSMLAIGQSLVPFKKSPDAFFVRLLGHLTGRKLPEEARATVARPEAKGWYAGSGASCFGRFGWEVGSGLLVGGIGSRLGVRNNEASYEFTVPRTGDTPRHVTFAGSHADALALDGEVATDGEKTCRVTASLGYPGVRWQFCRSTIEMHLGNLQCTAAIPTVTGVKVVSLAEGEEIDPRQLVKPWILISNGSEKDSPLLIVLQRRPSRVSVLRSGDAVRGLAFEVASGDLGVVVPTWIYGAASVDTSGWTSSVPKETLDLIDWWAPHALSYPIACRESFRLDERAKRVEIRSKYAYLRHTDEWKTEAAQYAPVSPVAWMLHDVEPAAGGGPIARFGGDVESSGLVTCFGDFAMREGESEVCWSLPTFTPATLVRPHVTGTEEFEKIANACFDGGVLFTCGGGCRVNYAVDRTHPFKEAAHQNISMHSHLHGMVRCTVNPFIYSEANRALMRRRLCWRLMEPLEVLQYKMVCRWRREPVSGVKYTIYMNSPRDISTVYEPETYGSKIIYGDSNETVRMILAATQIAADRMGQQDAVRANWDCLSRHVPSYAFANDDWLILCSGCLEWGGPGTIDMLNTEFGSMMSLARLAEIAGDEKIRAQALYRAARRICPTLARLKMLDYFAQNNLVDKPETRRQSVGFNESGAGFPLRSRPVHQMDFLDMSQGIPEDLVALYDWYGWGELRGDWFKLARAIDGAHGMDYERVACIAVGDDLPAADLLTKLRDVPNNTSYLKWLPKDWPGMDVGSYMGYAIARIYDAPRLTTCRDVNLHDFRYDPPSGDVTVDVTPGPHAALALNGRSLTLKGATRQKLTIKVK